MTQKFYLKIQKFNVIKKPWHRHLFHSSDTFQNENSQRETDLISLTQNTHFSVCESVLFFLEEGRRWGRK